MKKLLQVIFYLLLANFLFGCAAKPLKVDSSFWNKKGQKIGLAMVVPPTPASHKAGSQGLLDIAINNSMAGTLDAHLSTVDISGVNAILANLESELRKRGQVPVRLNPVKVDQLADFKEPGRPGEFAPKDLRPISGNQQLDAVLLVHITAAGTLRNYYGFIPTSAPSGYLSSDNLMVNAKDNKLIWSAPVSATQPVQGEWDQPPNYANIDSAIKDAVVQLTTNISKELFQTP